MAEMKDMSMEGEKEFTFSEAEYNEMMEQYQAERMKNLRRRRLPEQRTLHEALNAMTKPELEDIQYNLNLPMAGSLNRVKKAEMVESLEGEIVKFAGRWFVSAFQEQKDLFDYACQHEGLLTGLQQEDYRLDYLRGIGVLFCGMQKGELTWFMPEEIQAEYRKINNGAFADAVNLNTEVVRLSAGLVFYYGLIDYDQLYQKVCGYIDAELDFADFMGIIFNGGCWYSQIVAGKHDLQHESLMNLKALEEARCQYIKLAYAEFPYDRVYDAGEESYIESTEEYRALAQYLMRKKQLDVLKAAEAVRSIGIIIQNGYEMKDIIAFLAEHQLKMDTEAENRELNQLIGAYYAKMPLWVLKGHTTSEVSRQTEPTQVREGRKVGRNEPCPCGSGKKYKNCCLQKEY